MRSRQCATRSSCNGSKAELKERNRVVHEMTENLKVARKPLVLVHGLWSNWTVFESWQNILTTSHSYDWKAFPVGEVTNKGIINTGRTVFSPEQTNTMPDNAAVLGRYITYAQEDAWRIDVVAHSVGGLIGCYYINALMPVPSAHWTIADRVTQTRLHTDTIGTETFSSFIRPRLGIGPSGDHAPAAPNQ